MSIQSYLSDIDHAFIQQQKAATKRKIPVHISSKINKLDSPILLSIHSHLSSGDTAKAWKLFDKSILPLSEHPMPRATAHMLLESLYSDIYSNYARFSLNFGKIGELYVTRLEALVGLVKRSAIRHNLWDKRDFCMLIEMYGKLNQLRRAEALFRNMSQHCQDELCVDIYNEMLAMYVRRFKYESDVVKKRYYSKMESLETEMIRKNLTPKTSSYNLMLAAKVKLQDLPGAEKVLSRMKTPPNRMTYNILLNGFLKECRTAKDREAANKWLERLATSAFEPNARTFKNVIDGLAEQASHYMRMKETEEVKAIVQSVSSLHNVMNRLGYKIDTEMINTLLKCYTAANHVEHINAIMGMLALPERKGGCGKCGCGKQSTAQVESFKQQKKVLPDAYTFNILINHHLLNGRLEQALQMYNDMVTLKLDPDTTTYGSFISYYANQGAVEESLKYLDVMKKKGIPANNYIYNILLKCSGKYPQFAHLIAPHLDSILKAGVSLDTVSKNILLQMQTRSSQSLDTSFENFLDTLDRNLYTGSDISEHPALTTRTYNTLLQTSGRFYKAKKAKFNKTLELVMNSLDTSNVRPDILTFALEIRNASYRGDMIKAESIYKSMMDSGIKPNAFIFSHLIYGYSNIGRLDKAQDILRMMSGPPYKVIPSAINYAPLIKAYIEAAEYDKAHGLFREMLDSNITADLVIYTILAEAFLHYPAKNSGKRAIELLESIQSSGISMDTASLTLLASAYGNDAAFMIESSEHSFQQEENLRESLESYTNKINTIYEQLKRKNWLDSQAISALLSAHIQMKNLTAAWTLWKDCKSYRPELLNSHNYNTLLTGFAADKHWYPLAIMTFKDMASEERIRPTVYTFDTMIWAAHLMNDDETVEYLWSSPLRINPDTDKPFALLVRSYYAVLDTMLRNNKLNAAKDAFQEYQSIPSTPDSSTVWNNKINNLVSWQDFTKNTTY